MPASSTSRSAASSAPSAQTSVPMTSTGRCGLAEQLGDVGDRVAVGLGARPLAERPGGSTAEELKNSSIGMSTNTGPRCEEPASVKASCIPSATSSALWIVRASLETGATIGGVVELLERAGAPAVGRCAATDHDQRGAAELRLGDRR